MKNKIYFLIVSAIILIFSLILCLVLNDHYPVEGRNSFILYVVSKCAFSVCFIAIMLLGVLKRDIGNYVIQYSASVMIQFIPLLIRLLSPLANGFLASVIVFFIVLILYAAVIFGLNWLSKKIHSTEKQLEGKVIDIDKN